MAEAQAVAARRVTVSVGESVRIVRELQELSQTRLAELTGISRSTISAIENGRVKLDVERAKVLARALQVHPAVLRRSNSEAICQPGH
ncbi:MAG: helix-turn-helix transcriptional regulator [Candidatus Wenzhouxiangella sp. M2_3B_020]